ncbi:tRNA (guanosine(18)-2'-O)-methyltransferase [Dissulfuribacter thermophilus]|uniref:tRNA (guanosine(18)-2'-O)-methyltransferase n=1 Tax=Dissulfuribacter thermophilus TaxID=1156395 RepID=A0A1B9F3U5_9BACT|nr:RNA methyltransferase [Dissulfuribacter thermophilus]OCC14533.1 tRNA (guanosine(18)-2'-O)-methyltransferase [Dissulfuribacter thermophilus]
MDKTLLIQEKRLLRIKECLQKRQPDLRLYLENVQNHHNVSAIIRTADAVGILHIYYSLQKNLPVNDAITCGAHKWVILEKVEDQADFLKKMKSQGFQIVATALTPDAIDFRDIDYTRPLVIVMGNELEGISEELKNKADIICKIPMHGMVQSLNVSVATALILYEAQRQREQKGFYSKKRISSELEAELIKKWGIYEVLKKKSRGRLKGSCLCDLGKVCFKKE